MGNNGILVFFYYFTIEKKCRKHFLRSFHACFFKMSFNKHVRGPKPMPEVGRQCCILRSFFFILLTGYQGTWKTTNHFEPRKPGETEKKSQEIRHR